MSIKKELTCVVIGLLILNILGFFLADWLLKKHNVKIVVSPVAVQTDTVASVNTARTNETNLVSSGTNITNGISLKGKVQSGWGESK